MAVHRSADRSPKMDGRHKTRILLVDDNVDFVDTLALLLQTAPSEPYEVSVAYSGAQALRVVAEFRPDFVLLDMLMPGMDGDQVAKRLRQLPDFARVPIVSISALNDLNADRKAFDAHLRKPFAPEEVAKLVRELRA